MFAIVALLYVLPIQMALWRAGGRREIVKVDHVEDVVK